MDRKQQTLNNLSSELATATKISNIVDILSDSDEYFESQMASETRRRDALDTNIDTLAWDTNKPTTPLLASTAC